MPDRVVWLPTNSAGSAVRRTLAADAGDGGPAERRVRPARLPVSTRAVAA